MTDKSGDIKKSGRIVHFQDVEEWPDIIESRLRFAEHYANTLKAKKSAILAGYSAKTAGQIGHLLLREPEVRFHINRLMQERSVRTNIDADRVLQELARIAFLDPKDVFTSNEDGSVTLKDLNDIPPDALASIASIKQKNTEYGLVSDVKFHDKLSALEKIGKHLKLFTDVQEHKFNLTSMGQVSVKLENGQQESLSFEVGSDPNNIEDMK